MPRKDPEAQRAYALEYKRKNREKIREQERAAYHRRKTDPEFKARKAATAKRATEKLRASGKLPEVHRRANLKRYYGMTPADYDARLEEQGGVCAICKTATPGAKRKHFMVDHCHETRTIRGLLCTHCNLGLGKFGDNIEGLERALAYLKRHG